MDHRCGATFDEDPHVCYWTKMMLADLTSGSDPWRALLSIYNEFGCREDNVCQHVDKHDLTKTVGDITCPDRPSGGPQPPQVRHFTPLFGRRAGRNGFQYIHCAALEPRNGCFVPLQPRRLLCGLKSGIK